MSKATKETERNRPASSRAQGEGGDDKAADGLKPSDSEVSFQHLLRDMVIARDEARRKRG